MNRGPREIIGPSEAAAIVGMHPNTLSRWADKGKVRFMRTPGGQRRFLRSDIEALVEELMSNDKAAS